MLKEIVETAAVINPALVTLDVRESFLPGPNKSSIRAAATVSPRSEEELDQNRFSVTVTPQESSRHYVFSPSEADPSEGVQRCSSSTSQDPLYAKIDPHRYRHETVQVPQQAYSSDENEVQISEERGLGRDQNKLLDRDTETEQAEDTFIEYPVSPTPNSVRAADKEGKSETAPASYDIPPPGILKESKKINPGYFTTPTRSDGKKFKYPASVSSSPSSGGSSKAEFVFSPVLPPVVYQRLGIDKEKEDRKSWVQAMVIFLVVCVIAALIAMVLVFAILYTDIGDEESGDITNMKHAGQQEIELDLYLPWLEYDRALEMPQTERYTATTYHLLQHIDSLVYTNALLQDYYMYSELVNYRNSTSSNNSETNATIMVTLMEDTPKETVSEMKTNLQKIAANNIPQWIFDLDI